MENGTAGGQNLLFLHSETYEEVVTFLFMTKKNLVCFVGNVPKNIATEFVRTLRLV